MSYINTVKFLLATLKGKGEETPVKTINLVAGGKTFSTDIYLPQGKKVRGTILFIHGMNKLGNRDERMVALHRAAALSGYRAIAPNFDILAAHVLDAVSVDEFADTIKVIAGDKTLCETGKLGVFSASFSGCLSLRAMNQKSVGNLVSSFCSVGTCYQVPTTVENILSGKTNDPYARFIAVKACLQSVDKLDDEAAKALDYAIDDTFEVDGRTQCLDYISTLNDETKKEKLLNVYHSVMNGDDLSKDYEEGGLAIEKALLPGFDKNSLTGFVTLIHSATDMVLPTSESTLLYEQLVKHGISAKVLITPMLDHADVQISLRRAVDAVKLVETFDCFFRHI